MRWQRTTKRAEGTSRWDRERALLATVSTLTCNSVSLIVGPNDVGLS